MNSIYTAGERMLEWNEVKCVLTDMKMPHIVSVISFTDTLKARCALSVVRLPVKGTVLTQVGTTKVGYKAPLLIYIVIRQQKAWGIPSGDCCIPRYWSIFPKPLGIRFIGAHSSRSLLATVPRVRQLQFFHSPPLCSF